MTYSILGSCFSSVFAVPACVVDEHLKLCGGLSLKALLWILRNQSAADLDTLASALGQPRGEVIDALQFWVERGILLCDTADKSAQSIQKTQPIAQEVPPAVALPELPPVRPTQSQVNARLEESDELRLLFQEAQNRLGRTVGYDGQCTLLMLHDTYGLPVEVVPMLLQYCDLQGKPGWRYIETVGCDWGRRDIDTVEKAGEIITRLHAGFRLWNELARRTGITAPKPTARETAYLDDWTLQRGFDIDMIHLAYEETVERTGKISFSYMNKILQNWHKSGIQTPDAAEAAKRERLAKVTKGNPKPPKAQESTASAPSYDIEAFERSIL
ncbi:MAG: DnaD domain protein [Oscillospiraceae bacterium]|nr:DnaD domain protein [Oscillospiraceae bacterium]